MPLSTASNALAAVPRQSWPPTGLWPSSPSRIPPALDDDRDGLSTDEEDFDNGSRPENPLKYFLTPATPAATEDDELEFEFDFDAGIEDSNSPRHIVRSVSPSTLDGLRRYKTTKEPECAILEDDDDDDEDYIRFNSHKSLPISLDDYFDHPRYNSPSRSLSRSAETLLSPTSFHVGSPRGRLTKPFTPPPRRSSLRGRPAARTLQRRHSWREPSPDVWSIDEEPEKETMSEMGLSVEDLDIDSDKTKPIDIPAAKPRKKVRFLLPAKEM
ncbi:hypothetical protein F4808DRAFT_136687 [Astrocystis sublimbata]|nr:hypothetical protein F4808DRAFT_136687 [Astrocystis sublimbata]